ncbi:glycosyltransferase family 2 protein [Streptomyces sp. HMX87]|uniref:glycosyltransferase family 2 protein n=1 Tax=Streptomyces sp. HMX87 TaxID=3390849 RepID=UPI003A87BDFA
MAPGDLFFCFAVFYPVATGAVWMAGGLLFRLLEERSVIRVPAGGWPGVTVLVPAYNEEAVIARCVEALRRVDYPQLEVLVLNDGSHDGTVRAAVAAAAGDFRVRVLDDGVNLGRADRLNDGMRKARHELVVVTDADTHLHPDAIKYLVARITRSPRYAAVAGAPFVTNRRNVLSAMQVLETASLIGLIRRTHALAGRVGTVAGVLGLFRRDAVLAVGGYDPRMATEDIELTWRLLEGGYRTSFEPNALVGPGRHGGPPHPAVPVEGAHALGTWLRGRRPSRVAVEPSSGGFCWPVPVPPASAD